MNRKNRKYRDVKEPGQAWYRQALEADWASPVLSLKMIWKLHRGLDIPAESLIRQGALKNQVQHFSERMLHGKKLLSVEH